MKTAFERILMVCLIVSLVVAGVFGYVYLNERNENTTISKDLKDKKEELAKTKATSAIKAGSDKITIDVQAETPVKIEKVYVEKKIIDKAASEKLAAINAKYAVLEKTKENEEARDEELTLVRIKALWATYCLASADKPDCPETPMPKEKQ